MAQQTINIGTVANDRTGDTWRDGWDKSNDNFTELYTNQAGKAEALNNLTIVNELSDFPAPVGGVIELSGTAETVYVIDCNDIDIGANRFTVTNEACTILGSCRFASSITSSTTGDLFTVSNASFSTEFIGLHCANSPYAIRFSGQAASNDSLVVQNTVIFTTKSVFRIENAAVSSLRIATVVATSIGGIDWIGTGNGQINITTFLGISWVGTLINLGSATLDLINISTNSRFTSPTGTTILGGLVSNGNIKAGGRAIVDGVLFNGTGTAINNITTQDTQWDFADNIFVDGTTQNTRVAVNSFLDGTAQTVATAAAGAGVYILMDQNGTDWDSNKTLRFTQASTGIVTYTGLEDVDVYVQAFSTVERSGGGADVICTKIAIDVGAGFVVHDETIGCTENSTPTQVVSAGYFTLSTNDEVAVYVSNTSSAVDIIASQATLLINEIM